MRAVGLGVIVVGAALSASPVQGRDEPVDCFRKVCVSAEYEETMELSCGGSGEAIADLTFASFGQPIGDCPAEDDELFPPTMLENISETVGCHDESTKDKILEICRDKEECSFAVKDLFPSTENFASCDTNQPFRAQVHVKCGPKFDVFSIVIALLISFIGLALGASTEIAEFKRVIKEHKRAVLVGFCSQYGFMPFISYLLVQALDLAPLVAIGVVLIGCAPGGTTSNLFTYLSKGSVSLSITMSAASTLCSLFMIPIMSAIWIKGALAIEADVDLPIGDLMQTLATAVLPAGLGIYIRSKNAAVAKKVETAGVIFGMIFIAAAIAIGVKKNPKLLKVDKIPRVWIAAYALQPIGGIFGYLLATLVKLPRPERRAVCLETGIQNTTLIVAVVALGWTGCTRVEILTYPLLASLATLCNSVWMTALLRWSSKFDSEEEKKAQAASVPTPAQVVPN